MLVLVDDLVERFVHGGVDTGLGHRLLGLPFGGSLMVSAELVGVLPGQV